MGDAKRRKALDASYGRRKRGLVVSPPIEIDGSRLFVRSSALDPQELRSATLFWDRLVWPSSRAIHFGSGPDEQFLESAGILSRPDYTVDGDGAQGIAFGFVQAFVDRDRQEPGLWSLAQGENSLLLRTHGFAAGNAIQLTLHRAIPVPDKDVPLAEVLEFKQRRDAELLALRVEIDSMVAAVGAAEAGAQALAAQIAKVDKACADALRVGAEWQFPIRLMNLRTSGEIRPLAALAVGIAAFAGPMEFGLPTSAAVLTGIAGAAVSNASALKLSYDGIEFRPLRPRQGPWRYVYNFHKELF
jgi:hypothetical protein